MLPIKDPHDKKIFALIIKYLQGGGRPNMPFVLKFCMKYQIDAEVFAAHLSEDATKWVERLKQAGLI